MTRAEYAQLFEEARRLVADLRVHVERVDERMIVGYVRTGDGYPVTVTCVFGRW